MTQRAIDGEYVYFVTANVQNRRWYFVNSERAEKLGQAIQTSCRIKQFDLLAYCILPNHVHLLVKKKAAEDEPRGFGSATAQRTLGSVRCGDGGGKLGDLPDGAFLFPHRRLPSRRSPKKPPTLSDLMHSIKSTFSHYVHHGKFWQHRSNFRIIESQDYFNHVVDYILYNYRKMDLPNTYGAAPYVFVDWEAIGRVAG